MHVRSLILASLTLAGCEPGKLINSGSGCEGDPVPFSIDADFDTDTRDDLLSIWGLSDPAELSCEQLCDYLVEQSTGAEIEVLDACTHSLDASGADSADTAGEAVVGHVTCEGTRSYFCEGRRPLGHVEAACADPDLGPTLAACAHLEAASVLAFRQLVRQLRDWGAPETLIDRCQDAARDELAHARDIGRLARREGARLPTLRLQPAPEDRLSVALHNAAEGCVGESWASLLAFWKAQNALDPELRAAYARIAEDEARHAQLSWDLHAWLMSSLSPDQQAEVQARLARAAATLPQVAEAQARSLPRAFGLPSPPILARIAQDFAARLPVASA